MPNVRGTTRTCGNPLCWSIRPNSSGGGNRATDSGRYSYALACCDTSAPDGRQQPMRVPEVERAKGPLARKAELEHRQTSSRTHDACQFAARRRRVLNVADAKGHGGRVHRRVRQRDAGGISRRPAPRGAKRPAGGTSAAQSAASRAKNPHRRHERRRPGDGRRRWRRRRSRCTGRAASRGPAAAARARRGRAIADPGRRSARDSTGRSGARWRRTSPRCGWAPSARRPESTAWRSGMGRGSGITVDSDAPRSEMDAPMLVNEGKWPPSW